MREGEDIDIGYMTRIRAHNHIRDFSSGTGNQLKKQKLKQNKSTFKVLGGTCFQNKTVFLFYHPSVKYEGRKTFSSHIHNLKNYLHSSFFSKLLADVLHQWCISFASTELDQGCPDIWLNIISEKVRKDVFRWN